MAVFSQQVSLELHESIVAELRGQIEKADARYDRQTARLEGMLEAERVRYAELVKQLIEIKRHEHGMNPEGFNPDTLQPEHGLGVKTIAAIEEFAAGDPELRRYLVGEAHKEYRKRHDMDADERDAAVAKRIAQGDQG